VMQLAYCGLDCGACPALNAAERLTMGERQAVAEQWNASFGAAFTAADIDCTVVEGPHPSYCGQCSIRACASQRALPSCAECADYGCDKLAAFFAQAPEAKANLEARRA
jgi:Protein of unknown function (DUF3795)